MPKPRVIFIEGPDRAGKTHIAKAIAEKYGLAYWKNDDNAEYETPTPDAFANTLKYHYAKLPTMCKLFMSHGSGVVFDRNYISEWVYSKFFERDTHENIIEDLERKYTEMGAVVIYCTKDYTNFDDKYIAIENIADIKFWYNEYFNRKRSLPMIWLDTTSEDLNDQMKSIDNWLEVL